MYDRSRIASLEIERDPSDLKVLGKRLSGHAKPWVMRSVFELVVTLGLLLAASTVMLIGVQAGWPLVLLLAAPAGGLLLRLFVIQHDCGHGAFLPTRRANDLVGACLGVLTFTPYRVWKTSHASHHATSGNLGRRGTGDIDTLTVAEYRSLSRSRRLVYRLYRHPIVMFGIGPAYLFLLRHRLPVGQMKAGWRPWTSAMGTNAAALALFGALSLAWGIGTVVLVLLPIVLVAATFGVWLFFVQHQFEETSWSDEKEWTFHAAAIYGSSFYALPRLLHWFSGNIGYHHIHHLVSRIPFYRLPDAMKETEALRGIGRVTLGESFRNVRLALWDEDRRRMISFRAARKLASAGAV
ncbi:fatty acid desaturase [Sphingomicrobium sp. XHP0235]|uniref:fatty acid desaturase n=1 Tax=Sphingomicrobium aquimarinum TaxID=3133971 RepID=UPI0031FEA2D3